MKRVASYLWKIESGKLAPQTFSPLTKTELLARNEIYQKLSKYLEKF